MKNFLILWIISLFVKILISLTLPLTADETYYWVWGQNLDLSYYDHPGAVAWIFYVSSLLFPDELIRLPFILIGHLTLIVWKKISNDYLSENQQITFLSLLLFSPLTGVGSVFGTPDVPLVFFWSASIYFLMNHLSSPTALSSVLLGLSIGLGFCSKYHMILFVPTSLILISLLKLWGRVSAKYIFITTMTALASSLPVWLWNFQHDFVSFQFQIDHGLGGEKWQPYWTWSYFLGMLVLLFPPFVYFALRQCHSNFQKTMATLSAFTLLFFLITSFRGHVELNWPIVAIPSFLGLTASLSFHKKWLYLHNTLWGGVILAIMLAQLNILKFQLPQKLNEKSYYQPLVPVVQELPEVYASTYQMASYLWYLTQNPVYKLSEMSRIDYFDHKFKAQPNQDFHLLRETGARLPDWLNNSKFVLSRTMSINNHFELLWFTKQ